MDYFYYAQLRAQGEDSTEARQITGRVPLTEIGNLLRSLGFYPSEREIDEIVQEVHLSRAAGEPDADSIDFDNFLRLYINHRPVLGTSKEQIAQAFAAIGNGSSSIPRDELLRALQAHGEALSADDLAQCLRALLGTSEVEKVLPSQLDAPAFAEGVLGFEDYAQ